MRLVIAVTIALAASIAIPLASTAYPATIGTTNIAFNGDQHLVNPSQPDVLAVQDLEPGIHTDSAGDIYVNGIRGVPAGADMWKTTTAYCQNTKNNECPFFYMGQPDAAPGASAGSSVAPGGGDIDMAIGQPYAYNDCATGKATCPGSTTGNLYTASLTLANETTTSCLDGNLSNSSCYPPAVLSHVGGSEDRPWVAAEGKHVSYLAYQQAAGIFLLPGNITVCQSTNDGIAYPTCTQAIDQNTFLAAVANTKAGNIVVDNSHPVSPTPSTCVTPSAASPSCHYIYDIFLSVANANENVIGCPLHTVWMAVSNDSGATWTDHMVYNAPVTITGTGPTATCTGPSFGNIFPVVATDGAGNAYAEWSDGSNVYYSSSTNHGKTWNGKTDGTGIPTRVDLPYGPTTCIGTTRACGLHTAIFPWLAAAKSGHVDFVWYGTASPSSDVSTAVWSVFFAETFNGTAFATKTNPTAGPTIYQTIANHISNHVGQICLGGAGCTANRTLGDFFQVAIEPGTSCAVIAYDNDRNSKLATQAYFNRQLSSCTAAP